MVDIVSLGSGSQQHGHADASADAMEQKGKMLLSGLLYYVWVLESGANAV